MRFELIGKKMEIAKSRNKNLEGMSGKIVDETRNTLVVDTPSERKIILKAGSTFKIEGKEVLGNEIVARPEDRVKR